MTGGMSRLYKAAAALLIILLAWWAWATFSPSEREQMLAMQQKFLTALEERDWGAVHGMVSSDYADEWGYEKASVEGQMKELLSQFFFLSITPQIERVQVVKGLGLVVTRLKLEGNGAGFSGPVVAHANAIHAPWFFHWHKRGRWPWSWELVQVHNDEAK